MMRRGLFKGLLVILLAAAFISGCSLPLRYLAGLKKAVRVPQLVAHLEPSLQNNRIAISGKIILENPTESDLLLGKIFLKLKDGLGNDISSITLDWERPQIKSKGYIEAPVEVFLPLKILNQETVQVSIKTVVVYKALAVRVPIESEIAVFHLAPLKNSLTGPLVVSMRLKVSPDLFGNARVIYVFRIFNPFNVDLSLEDGVLDIDTQEKGRIGGGAMQQALLASRQETLIQGQFLIQNVFRDLFFNEFIKGHAIKVGWSGKLRLPQTDIYIPFRVEAVQEIDFLWGGRKR